MKRGREEDKDGHPESYQNKIKQTHPPFGIQLVWQKDISGRYIWCNDVFAHSVGKDVSEIPGLTDSDLYPNNIAEQYKNEDQQVIESGCELSFREECNQEHSKTYWQTHKFPVRDNQGTITGTFGESVEVTEIMNDIVKRIEAETQVIEYKKQLNRIVNNLPGFVYHCLNDRNWTMLFLSHRFTEITGYETEEVLNNKICTFNDLIHPDDRELLFSIWEKSLRNNCEFEEEYRIITKSDQVKWVWERGKGIRNEAGELLYIDGIIMDITQKKEAIEKQKEFQNRFKRITENADDIIFRFELYPKPHLTYINPAVERLTGFTVEECLANYNIIFSNLHKDERPFMQKITEQLDLPNKPFALRWQHKKGNWLWMETKVAPIFDQDNKLIAVEGITRDITEKKIINDQIASERILLRTIIDAVPDTLYVKDIEGRKILANKAEMKILNVNSIEEYYGKPDTEFYSKDAGEKYWADDQEVLKNRKPKLNIEEKVIDKYGNTYWLLTSKVPFYDKDGNLAGIVGIGRDFSVRKSLQDELDKYRNHLEELVKERTAELEEKNKELQRLNDLFVGREFRIKDLKDKIKELQSELGRNKIS